MRKGLQQASERYIPLEDSEGVNPISELDAMIINQFFEIIGKLTDNTSLDEIMENYKVQPDSNVYDALTTFNESFDPGDMNTRSFIRLQDQRIPIDLIQSIEPVDGYDNDIKAPTYKILINKTENIYVKLANKKIEYSDPEERDDALKELETKLEDTGKVRFL